MDAAAAAAAAAAACCLLRCGYCWHCWCCFRAALLVPSGRNKRVRADVVAGAADAGLIGVGTPALTGVPDRDVEADAAIKKRTRAGPDATKFNDADSCVASLSRPPPRYSNERAIRGIHLWLSNSVSACGGVL